MSGCCKNVVDCVYSVLVLTGQCKIIERFYTYLMQREREREREMQTEMFKITNHFIKSHCNMKIKSSKSSTVSIVEMCRKYTTMVPIDTKLSGLYWGKLCHLWVQLSLKPRQYEPPMTQHWWGAEREIMTVWNAMWFVISKELLRVSTHWIITIKMLILCARNIVKYKVQANLEGWGDVGPTRFDLTQLTPIPTANSFYKFSINVVFEYLKF